MNLIPAACTDPYALSAYRKKQRNIIIKKGDTKVGLFSKKQAPPKPLSVPASVIITCSSIPFNDKAVYWFEVSLNDQTAGIIEHNGVPAVFTAVSDMNVLALTLHIKDRSGKVTKYPSRKQTLELRDGETVSVLFENRKFIVGADK